eukprot:GHVS01072416.1.p1 GENE.GHVS01072416.1~~GHVS01072416.1.p1  ORF type:complete len:873 (-),score=111.61 GHVS01072416.1:610-3228(-)
MGEEGKWQKEGERVGGGREGKDRVEVSSVENLVEQWSETACGGGKNESNNQQNRDKENFTETNKWLKRYSVGGQKLRLVVSVAFPVLLLFTLLYVSIDCTTSSLEHRRTTPISTYGEKTILGSWKAWGATLMNNVVFLGRTEARLRREELAVASGGSEGGGVQMEIKTTRILQNTDTLTYITKEEWPDHGYLAYGSAIAVDDVAGEVKLLSSEYTGSTYPTLSLKRINQDEGTEISHGSTADELRNTIKKMFNPKTVLRLSTNDKSKILGEEEKCLLSMFIEGAEGHVSIFFHEEEKGFAKHFQELLMVAYDRVVVSQFDFGLPVDCCLVKWDVSLEPWTDAPKEPKCVPACWDADDCAAFSFASVDPDAQTQLHGGQPAKVFMKEQARNAALFVGFAVAQTVDVKPQLYRLGPTPARLQDAAVHLALGMICNLAGRQTYLLIEDRKVFARVKQAIEADKTLIQRLQLALSRVNNNANRVLNLGNGVSVEMERWLTIGHLTSEPQNIEPQGLEMEYVDLLFQRTTGDVNFTTETKMYFGNKYGGLMADGFDVDGDSKMEATVYLVGNVDEKRRTELATVLLKFLASGQSGHSAWSLVQYRYHSKEAVALFIEELLRINIIDEEVSPDWRLRLLVDSSFPSVVEGLHKDTPGVIASTASSFGKTFCGPPAFSKSSFLESNHAVVQVEFSLVLDEDVHWGLNLPIELNPKTPSNCRMTKMKEEDDVPTEFWCWHLLDADKGAALVITPPPSDKTCHHGRYAKLFIFGQMDDRETLAVAKQLAITSLSHVDIGHWGDRFVSWTVEVPRRGDKTKEGPFMAGFALGLGSGEKESGIKESQGLKLLIKINNEDIFSNIRKAFVKEIMNEVTPICPGI